MARQLRCWELRSLGYRRTMRYSSLRSLSDEWIWMRALRLSVEGNVRLTERPTLL